LLRGSTSHISRVQDARDELAKAWLVELVERTPVSELGDIGIEWLSQEAPALIASVLGALTDPGSAADRELSPSELRRAGELSRLRRGETSPARLPRDLAALQALLIEALRREIPDRESGEFARAVERLAEIFGALQAAVAEQLVRAGEGRPAPDRLAGLGGPSELQEWLRIVLESHRTDGHPFSLMVVEVEGLAQISAAYGDEAGDKMLHAVADVVGGQLRSTDRAFRIDEDELCVLFPQQGPLPTLTLAESLAKTIEGSQGESSPRVEVNLGIASCPEHGRDGETLLAAAEEAAFSARAKGESVGVASSERGFIVD
jgi:diguanylate cyclase (GGDEF)-like protein